MSPGSGRPDLSLLYLDTYARLADGRAGHLFKSRDIAEMLVSWAQMAPSFAEAVAGFRV